MRFRRFYRLRVEFFNLLWTDLARHANGHYHGAFFIFDACPYGDIVIKTANRLFSYARNEQHHFVTVKLTKGTLQETFSFTGVDCNLSNHLDLDVSDLSPETATQRMFSELYQMLPVAERMYLIKRENFALTSEEQRQWPDFKYCTLSDSHKFKKSDKIVFTALIMISPHRDGEDCLRWEACDHTGTSSFCYHWKVEHRSRETWDTVIGWRPGERKVLPRAPQPGGVSNRSGLKGMFLSFTDGLKALVMAKLNRMRKGQTCAREISRTPLAAEPIPEKAVEVEIDSESIWNEKSATAMELI
ncbi:MAG: hypothetical protein Q9227_008582 [Pyrenula ochraceoflavens]